MTSRSLRPLALLALPMAVLAALFFAPLVTMIRQSLAARDAGGHPAGFTLAQYGRFFGDPFYLEALGVTLGTSVLVAVLTAALSYPVAYVFWRSGAKGRSLLTVLLLSPFYANVVVKVFGWMVLLSPAGLVNAVLQAAGLVDRPVDLMSGYGAVVLVSLHRAMPFMVLLIASAMANIDGEVLEAARVCGATAPRIFGSIILPLSVPGALAGGVIVFSLTVAAYVVPVLVGGPAAGRFLPVLMYQQIAVAQNWPFGAAVGIVLLVAALAAVAAGHRAVGSIRVGRAIREGFAG